MEFNAKPFSLLEKITIACIGFIALVEFITSPIIHELPRSIMPRFVSLVILVLWNSLPVFAFYFITRKRFKEWNFSKPARKVGLILLALALAGIPALLHIAWIADYNGLATRATTTALVLVFFPLCAFVLALIPLVLLKLTERFNKPE